MAEGNIMDLFKVMLLVQLFYAFAITSLAYGMPAESLNFVTSFQGTTNSLDMQTVTQEVQENLQSQTNIPVIELGALVFYSGNILIDLLLNFLTAIPQMLAMLVNGLTMMFAIDTELFVLVELFAVGVVSIMYILGIIQLLTGIRSGRLI